MSSKDLKYEVKNVWNHVDDQTKDQIFDLNNDYKKFLDASKTERWAVREILRRAEANGFKDLNDLLKSKSKLNPGDKVYKINRDKGLVLYVIGTDPIVDGLNIIGSHLDSPRLDLKQVPLYENSEMAYLKTHYYGGIKKYQWLACPLELHGFVLNSKGEKLDIIIGDEDNDPVMYITDILPHLAKDQMAKKAGEFVDGESLNLLVGSIPLKGDGKDKVKENILNILNEKYGLIEEDFVSAEFEVVPAGKSRDVGLDRSMVMGYGHDDRVCAYTSLEAILNIENPTRTAVALFVDKEEIGSTGNTGMASAFMENSLMDLIYLMDGQASSYISKRSLENSYALSADVAAIYDPKFASAYELNNSSQINKGVTIVKYTGSRGKGGSSDANPEFVAYIRNLFNENNVYWQTGELGKVDQGGGGTIAFILAEYGMEVLDCGVGVLSMHAPYELVSKADVYMAYKAYKAFYQA